MTSPFAARRKARVIAQDEGDEDTRSGQDVLPKEQSKSFSSALGGIVSDNSTKTDY